MKAAFDAKARGEETLSFYDKMKSAHERAGKEGYRFVVAFAAEEGMSEYSVAFVSRGQSDEMAFADLDNFSWAIEHAKPLAVLDTHRPFLGMLEKGPEAESYFSKPAIHIPEAAQTFPDTKKLFFTKPKRAAFRVIEGDKPAPDLD